MTIATTNVTTDPPIVVTDGFKILGRFATRESARAAYPDPAWYDVFHATEDPLPDRILDAFHCLEAAEYDGMARWPRRYLYTGETPDGRDDWTTEMFAAEEVVTALCAYDTAEIVEACGVLGIQPTDEMLSEARDAYPRPGRVVVKNKDAVIARFWTVVDARTTYPDHTRYPVYVETDAEYELVLAAFRPGNGERLPRLQGATATMNTITVRDAMELALRQLESEENDGGWDRPARVYLVYEERDHAGLLYAIPRELTFPEAVRSAIERPPELLEVLAGFMEQEGGSGARESGVVGCALMAEAWEVRPRPGQPKEVYERVQAAAERHELYQHPGRREVRTVWAMDRDGWFYEVRRPRRGTQGVTLLPPDDPNRRVEGAVAGALRRIIESNR